MISQWPTVPLGELVDVLDHKRVPVSATERATRHGSVPYYGATGQVGWIDEALFNEPLLLLGEDGVQFFDRDKRKAYLVDGPAWVNNHAHVLRARVGEVDRRYLLHYLNWIDYHGLANGTTRLKLTKSAMCSVPVLLPQLSEQRRIVGLLEDHLSRLDAGDAGITAVRQGLDRLIHAARATVWSTAESVGQLRCVSDLGLVVTGSTPKDRLVTAGQETIPFVTPGDVGHGGEVRAAARSVPRVAAERVLTTSSVLAVCIGATLGKVGWTVTPVATNQQINAVLLGQGHDARFVAALMASPQFQRRMGSASSATTMPILNKSRFSALQLPIVELPLQQELARQVAAVSDRCEIVDKQVERGRSRRQALRHSLLAAAFSGGLH